MVIARRTLFLAAVTLASSLAAAGPSIALAQAGPRDSVRVALYSVGQIGGKDSSYAARVRRVDSLVHYVVFMQGVSVVPPDTVEELSRRLQDSLGGVYDTLTGKPDSAKVALIRQLAARQLWTRYHAPIRLSPRLQIVAVEFSGGKAKWCGVSELTGAPGGIVAFMGHSYTGKLRAMQLTVFAFDTLGKTLYTACGGLQLLTHVTKAGQLANVPQDSALTDSAAVYQAARLALDSLSVRLFPPGNH